jgi:hypothetical protein
VKKVSRGVSSRDASFEDYKSLGTHHRQLSKVAIRLATYATDNAMLQILATLPVTTATGGKSFCALMYVGLPEKLPPICND